MKQHLSGRCKNNTKNMSLSKSESSAPTQMQEKKNATNETHKSCHKILMPIGNSFYQAHTKQYLTRSSAIAERPRDASCC